MAGLPFVDKNENGFSMRKESFLIKLSPTVQLLGSMNTTRRSM